MMSLTKNVKKKLDDLLSQFPLVVSIVNDIREEGGVCFLVGGAVRDLLLDLPLKDLDIEIHKTPLHTIENILRRYGIVNSVGKAFGVMRLESLDIDWSIPRADQSGRKPLVTVDPWMDIKKAFERRDLTMNAMGINLVTYELVDPFNGLDDIHHKILRTPNPALFIEDPLRFYRVMQFVSRFSMKPDIVLDRICTTMHISHISHERIEVEFKKWLLLSKKPSQSLDWLNSIGRLKDVLPEVAATKNVLQEPDWHPEGDVFEHTKQAVDAAAVLNYQSNEEKLTIMYAVLCHDLGKVTTTKLINDRLTSYDHAKKGVIVAQKLLKRITHNKALIDAVCKLVDAHLYPGEFIKNHARSSAYKRLALKLSPDVTLSMLALVATADKQGRNPQRGYPLTSELPVIDQFLKKAESIGVLTTIEKPILQGKDLMPEIEPGPLMGSLVKEAYALQLQEDIHDKALLKERVLKKIAKNF
jgi:tRNA nucleotidyltransferase (CCA-adding enzyme)